MRSYNRQIQASNIPADINITGTQAFKDEVGLSLTIRKILEIDDNGGRMRLNVKVELEWADDRLLYLNLKDLNVFNRESVGGSASRSGSSLFALTASIIFKPDPDLTLCKIPT
jgi:hypothetical protein